MSYLMECNVSSAPRFWAWIKTRQGINMWRSADLSNPGKSWSGPVLDPEGKVNGKPSWQSQDKPEGTVTDPSLIEVYEGKEHKRFRVTVRVSGNGLSFKCTDASSRRIEREVEKAGEGAYYEFDYETQECVIFVTTSWGSLKEYAEKRGW